MAFSPEAFKKSMGPGTPPPGGPAGSPPPMGGMDDMEGLMSAPPGISPDGDMDAKPESSEGSLEQALEGAGFQATPEQISEIKQILGVAGGMEPALGAESEGGLPPPPEAPKPTNKISKLFGK